MKKRLLSVVIASAMALSLVACGEPKSELKDGKYTVESAAADERGYKGTLTLEVKDGKIASADYNESKDGVSKETDASYNEKMLAKSGTNPEKVYPELEKAIVEKQSAEVDTITGATKTSDQFKKFAEKALENAKAGNTEKATL